MIREGMMIRIRALRKVYSDGHCALGGIDLDLGEGMFGLLGPNGAGKTTFLSILVLALQPSGGTMEFFSLDPRRASDRAAIRALIGFLPQNFAPIGHLTGFEYLLHCARVRNVPLSSRALRDRARLLLEAVELREAAGRRCGTYSGGMRRRLGIAQALIHAPRLLVVDEPTAGLDPEERIRFRNLITDAAEETAVLLSTHISEDIEATCDRIGVIAAGRMLFDGSPADLIRRAVGTLWRIPADGVPPAGAVPIARRMYDGDETQLVFSAEQPRGAAAHEEISLEEGYSALLASEGIVVARDDA